uniref:Centrosomal protein 128 n=1 Tax=Sphaeramia orbicularis TaxID=375764 RepID=A0A672ZBT0_9TELE
MLGQYREVCVCLFICPIRPSNKRLGSPFIICMLVSKTKPYNICMFGSPDGQRFFPTSPLRDYGSTPGRRRRRSQSASVHFKDTSMSKEDIHTLHQSLRDLRCDQERLTDDLEREILRRNRYGKGKIIHPRQNTKCVSESLLTDMSSSSLFYCPCLLALINSNYNLIMSGCVCVCVRACLYTCADRTDLEREVAELRVQLCKASVLSEVEELKRALECREKEKVQLSLEVQVCKNSSYIQSSFQSQEQEEKKEMEALLQESKRSRDELKTRAQEAVRQWRAKCKRLQKELEDERAQALIQQTEAARRELAEILGRLAQREEELHRKDVDLSETRQRQLSLEEASAALEEETRNQAAIQARLREENQRLEERADTQARHHQREEDKQVELQAALKQMSSSHAQLSQRLAEEESSRKDLQKGAAELQAKLKAIQEEKAALGQQLQVEREVHRKELDNMKAIMEDSRSKKDRDVQDMLKLCRHEREEIQAQMKEVKADAASDKELCGVLRIKLDRMKDECDKLASQLSTKDEAHTLLQRKYQLLKQELDDKVSLSAFALFERRHVSESQLIKLEEKVLQMEAEQEAVLTSMGEELDAACRGLAPNGEDKLQSKLRWLCEEVRECNKREQNQRKQHHQTKDQLKALRRSRDSEQAALLQRLDQQEKLLRSLSAEKKELLERSRSKEEEMRSLQVSVEYSYRLALDHLESIPEKQCLMENFKDLEESQRQRELVEQRYTKYKEIVWDLQHQLDESKRRIQEYRVCHTQLGQSQANGTNVHLNKDLSFD